MKQLSLTNPRLSGLCLLMSWLLGAAGFLLGLAIEPMWFARFGSLVVLFALMGEFPVEERAIPALRKAQRQ